MACVGVQASEVRPASVIYGGIDTRNDLSSESPAWALRVGHSVAMMIDRRRIQPILSGKFFKVTAQKLGVRKNLCPGTKYYDQPSIRGACTAFLVGKDQMITAAHCLRHPLAHLDKVLIFDFTNSSLSDNGDLIFESDQIYSIKTASVAREVHFVDRVVNDTSRSEKMIIKDHALLTLERSVVGRIPLEWNFTEELTSGTELSIFGHPDGISQKMANGVVESPDRETFFYASLDSFSGNSGSPVINKQTMKVEGLLSSGEADYIVDSARGCKVVHECTFGTEFCLGEAVLRSSNFNEFSFPALSR